MVFNFVAPSVASQVRVSLFASLFFLFIFFFLFCILLNPYLLLFIFGALTSTLVVGPALHVNTLFDIAEQRLQPDCF